MWQAWSIGILGLWFVVSAFFGFNPTTNLWNDLIIGLVVLLAAGTVLKKNPWQAWLALIFGVWMIIAAFIPSLIEGTGYLYNNLISGIIIAVAGFAMFGSSSHKKLGDDTHMSHMSHQS